MDMSKILQDNDGAPQESGADVKNNQILSRGFDDNNYQDDDLETISGAGRKTVKLEETTSTPSSIVSNNESVSTETNSNEYSDTLTRLLASYTRLSKRDDTSWLDEKPMPPNGWAVIEYAGITLGMAGREIERTIKRALLEGFDAVALIAMIDDTAKAKRPSLDYLAAILRRCQQEGCYTAQQYLDRQDKYRRAYRLRAKYSQEYADQEYRNHLIRGEHGNMTSRERQALTAAAEGFKIWEQAVQQRAEQATDGTERRLKLG